MNFRSIPVLPKGVADLLTAYQLTADIQNEPDAKVLLWMLEDHVFLEEPTPDAEWVNGHLADLAFAIQYRMYRVQP